MRLKSPYYLVEILQVDRGFCVGSSILQTLQEAQDWADSQLEDEIGLLATISKVEPLEIRRTPKRL